MATKKAASKHTKKIAPPAVESTEITRVPVEPDQNMLASVITKGDLSMMNYEQLAVYYTNLCRSLSLNPLTRPFDLLVLNGKKVLYANKNAAEQLREQRGVSVTAIKTEHVGDIYIVTVNVSDKTGRMDAATGAVNLKGLSGDMLANKLMTAETKAKRRATLSICSLGMLDESELDTIPQAQRQTLIISGSEQAKQENPAPTEPEYPSILPDIVTLESAMAMIKDFKSKAAVVAFAQAISPKVSAWNEEDRQTLKDAIKAWKV